MWQYELIGGPQDGVKVMLYDDLDTIYVGPKWLGDGYAAYSNEYCDRFPIRYTKVDKYRFGYQRQRELKEYKG